GRVALPRRGWWRPEPGSTLPPRTACRAPSGSLEGRGRPTAPGDRERCRTVALAGLPAAPAGRRSGPGIARRVLHLRHAALARARPLDRLVRNAVGDLDRGGGRPVCLFGRRPAAHRPGAA